MKKAKCEPVTQKLARSLPVVKIAECQSHLSESQPTSSSRSRLLLRAASTPCLRVNDEATRPRIQRTKSTVFDYTLGEKPNCHIPNCFNRCKRFLSFSSYESSCPGLQLTSNYMATTLTCRSKANPCQRPLPCGRCANSCRYHCLPPSCNNVSKCVQNMNGNGDTYGFWFRGSYHVMDCCYPCSPNCCNPSTRCSSKDCCAYIIPPMNNNAASSRILPKFTLNKLVGNTIKKFDAKALSLNPGPTLSDSSATFTTLPKFIFCPSVTNSLTDKSLPVTAVSALESVSDVIPKPKDNRSIKGVLDVIHLGNICTTDIFEKCQVAFNSRSSEFSDVTQSNKFNLDSNMSALMSTCALYDPFVALCTGTGFCPSNPRKESSAASNPPKVPRNSSPAYGCCCSCGPCGCGPCGSCPGPCPSCLRFNCGPQGCNCCCGPCSCCGSCGCGPCPCGPCACGPCPCPCACGSCGCAPCGCGPCGCGKCSCGPCFPPCLPCPINPGDQSSGPLAAGADLRFPTRCCGIFTGDLNLGRRIQDPNDSHCQNSPNKSDSICFCETCRANRTQTYAVSQYKTDKDSCANLEPNIPSKTSKHSSKVLIDPKLAKEYPFSKNPPQVKGRFC